jgi:TolB-like protein
MDRLSRLILLVLLVSFSGSLANAQTTLAVGVQTLATDLAERLKHRDGLRIAIAPFADIDGRTSVLGAYISEEITTHLLMHGSLDIVERTMLTRVFEELQLTETGAVDPATAKQVGKLAGVSVLITGTITDLQSFVSLNCRVIDTETGRIIAAAQAKIVKDDDVRKVLGVPLQTDHARSATSGRNKIDYPEVEAESYRLVVEGFDRRGGVIILTLVIVSTVDVVNEIFFDDDSRDTYLVDENGDRWVVQGSEPREMNPFRTRTDLIPGTRVRTILSFASERAETAGEEFTFVTREAGYRGKRIVIYGLRAMAK